jgi:hypothetical protein
MYIARKFVMPFIMDRRVSRSKGKFGYWDEENVLCVLAEAAHT